MKNYKPLSYILALLFAIGVLVYIAHEKIVQERLLGSIEIKDGTQATSLKATAFEWRYEEGGVDRDGLPKTRVFLDVRYENEKLVPVEVDEVQGSCNEVDASSDDRDMVKGTSKIQCYAAGYGEWYKIIKADNLYQVVRKYFEEGSPEYDPPEQPYEVVAEVPFVQ